MEVPTGDAASGGEELPKEVLREMMEAITLMVLCQYDLLAPISRCLSVSDACETGGCVCSQLLPILHWLKPLFVLAQATGRRWLAVSRLFTRSCMSRGRMATSACRFCAEGLKSFARLPARLADKGQ